MGNLLGFETKEVAGVCATTSTSPSAARTDCTSRTSSSASSRSTSAPTPPPRRSRSSAARPGRTSRRVHATRSASSRASSSSSTPSGSKLRSIPYDLSSDWLERLGVLPVPRDRTTSSAPSTRSRTTAESPRPMDRLVCRDVGFGKTEVAVRAAFAVAVNGRQALVLCPTTSSPSTGTRSGSVSRLPNPRRDGLALPQARRGQGGAARVRRGAGRGSRGHAPDRTKRDVVPEAARARDRRRGAALRCPAEGTPPCAASRSTCSPSLRRDPPHAPHVARRPAGHRHRDAAGGPPADPDDGRRVRRRGSCGSRSSRSTRAKGRRSTCATESRRSTRPRRSCSSSARPAVPRRARPDGRARARRAHARVPGRGRRRARVDHDHRVRARHPPGQHAGRRERADTLGLASSTRSAGGSDAPT